MSVCQIIVLMLHTGLRIREDCTPTRTQVKLGKRSGMLQVCGKCRTSHEIPWYDTGRAILEEELFLRQGSYDPTPLLLSAKTHARVPPRGGGYLIRNDAERAKLHEVSPHGLRHRFGSRLAACVPLHRLAHTPWSMTHLILPWSLHEASQAICTTPWKRLCGTEKGCCW
jgi:site-specific recombinase XerC